MLSESSAPEKSNSRSLLLSEGESRGVQYLTPGEAGEVAIGGREGSTDGRLSADQIAVMIRRGPAGLGTTSTSGRFGWRLVASASWTISLISL